MCLPIDSCFGFGTPRTDDYRRSHDPPQPGQGLRNATHYNVARYNGNGNGNGAHYGNGVKRDLAHVVPAVAPAPRGWNGHAATAAQDKAAAWNGKAAPADGHGARGGAPNDYYSSERAQKDAAAADSYYPAATATAADYGSPSEALGGE